MIVESHDRDCCVCEMIEETRTAQSREPTYGEMYLCGLLMGRYEGSRPTSFALTMCPLHYAKWDSYLRLAKQKESA